MNCRETRALLSEYIDEELGDETREHVTEHLGGCAACAKEHHALRRTVRFVQGNSGRLPDTSAAGSAYASFNRAIVDEGYGQRPEEALMRAAFGQRAGQGEREGAER